MMARYFPMLEEMTGGRMVVEVQGELLPLLAANHPGLSFIPRLHGVAPEADYDLWIGAMSLPYLFGDTADSIPGTKGYIKAPAESLAYWHERVAQTASHSPRIGLAWSGNPRHPSDRRRSIPFEMIAPYIARLSGLTFIAVQTTGMPAQAPANLVGPSEELITFGDTAALMDALDLIITVDTSAVHLAGAMGKAAWLMLPYRYEWRWGIEGEKNPWYDTVSVLRQSSHGDWHGILEEIFTKRLPAWLDWKGGQ